MERRLPSPPVFPAPSYTPPLGLLLDFLIYCDAVQEWDVNLPDTVLNFLYNLWEILMLVYFL